MYFWILVIRIIFLSQTTIGILGNSIPIFYYLDLYYRERTLKPIDLILMHLMAANSMIILSAGVPYTIAAFGFKQFLNEFGCRLLIFTQAFGRSVSNGITCLLSVFQTMIIRPRKSCWKDYKLKAVNDIGCFISLIWLFFMFINLIFFVYPFIKLNCKNVTRKWNFGYCSIVGCDEISDLLYTILLVCPELFFAVLIALSSGSMIVFLYRHKKRIQHIHSSHGSNRITPESRASWNILILVLTFLVFYTLSSTLRGSIALLHNHNWWLENITPLISLCFPSFGPFVLMNHYFIVSRLILTWIRNKNNLILFEIHKC